MRRDLFRFAVTDRLEGTLMKRSVRILALLTLLLILASALAQQAMACDLPGCDQTDTGEVETWQWDSVNEKWVLYGTDAIEGKLARAFKGGSASGSCNKQSWQISLTTAAAVAQWIDWDISNTSWLWAVLKPGTYAADCIELRIKSNGPITLSFTGFGDLTRQNPPEGWDCKFPPVASNTNTNIDTQWAVIPVEAPDTRIGLEEGDVTWLTPGTDSGKTLIVEEIPDSMALHGSVYYKLFNKITVVDCNSAGYYANTGTITISMPSVVCFVDGGTGTWKY